MKDSQYKSLLSILESAAILMHESKNKVGDISDDIEFGSDDFMYLENIEDFFMEISWDFFNSVKELGLRMEKDKVSFELSDDIRRMESLLPILESGLKVGGQ